MVLKRTELLTSIADALAVIRVSCEQRGWLHLLDNHVAAQHFFCRFVNVAFGLDLVEMDQIQANFPAIDLGDRSHRVAYQVTVERRSDKVQHTLDKFVEHGLALEYDTLRILIIGNRQATYRSVKVPPQCRFDCDRDIMGMEQLIKHIQTLDTDRLEKLQVVLAEEVQLHLGNVEQSRDAFRLVGVPYAPVLFIGRGDDLVEMKRRLVGVAAAPAATSPQVLSAMRGWPGVGKTTLATVLAHDPDIRSAFRDGVLWTSLGITPNILAELMLWSRSLGAESVLQSTTMKQAVVEMTHFLRGKRFLVVVDDVWSIEQASPFRQLTPHTGALLFTTRVPEVADQIVPAGEIYNLPVLNEAHALELLRRIAPAVVSGHLEESLKLIHDLECLPLAIQVAGRLLATELKNNWGVTELLAELQTTSNSLLQAKAPIDCMDLRLESIPTVAALLEKSTDRLTAELRDRFACLGAFAPRPASFDLRAIEAVWEVTDARPHVRQLADRGLLEPCREGRFQMHSLLVAHAKSLCTE